MVRGLQCPKKSCIRTRLEIEFESERVKALCDPACSKAAERPEVGLAGDGAEACLQPLPPVSTRNWTTESRVDVEIPDRMGDVALPYEAEG